MSKNSFRHVLTPLGTSRKRKDRNDALDAPRVSATKRDPQAEPQPDNRLLAGYLAHEFLTKGTIFGQRWDPARPEPAAESKKPSQTTTRAEPRAYAEVAHLLKMDGPHISGIVNPSQLNRWLQM